MNNSREYLHPCGKSSAFANAKIVSRSQSMLDKALDVLSAFGGKADIALTGQNFR